MYTRIGNNGQNEKQEMRVGLGIVHAHPSSASTGAVAQVPYGHPKTYQKDHGSQATCNS